MRSSSLRAVLATLCLSLVACLGAAATTPSSDARREGEATGDSTEALSVIGIGLDWDAMVVDLRFDWQKTCDHNGTQVLPKRYFVQRPLDDTCALLTSANGGTWKGRAGVEIYGTTSYAMCEYEWTSTSYPDAKLLQDHAGKAHGKPNIDALCGGGKATLWTPPPLLDGSPLHNVEMMSGCPKCAMAMGNSIAVANDDGDLPTGQPLRIWSADNQKSVEFTIAPGVDAVLVQVPDDGGIAAALGRATGTFDVHIVPDGG